MGPRENSVVELKGRRHRHSCLGSPGGVGTTERPSSVGASRWYWRDGRPSLSLSMVMTVEIPAPRLAGDGGWGSE